MNKVMIVSRTPLRMSFVGGGSDLSSFYHDEMGAVLSTSIEKYVYICVNSKFDGKIRVSYSETENIESWSDIKHPLVRESLGIMGIKEGIEIASLADIPSNGSGLGSSSAYTVGLINALSHYKKSGLSKGEIARLACEIEINRCQEPIGKQDQYAAAFGGLNVIRFLPDESVIVDPLICLSETVKKLQENIIVFFTGRTRSASKVLVSQFAALRESDKKVFVRRMVSLVFAMKQELECGRLDEIGTILDENWRLKSQLTSGISDGQINHWYSIGLSNGALGGKLLGAGNGGFLMFYAPRSEHERLAKALLDLRVVNFKFDKIGTMILVNEQEGYQC